MSDPLLNVIAVGSALLVVIIKSFGFSILSRIVGLKLEDSFRPSLYMLAMSMGVIIAKDAVVSGVASQGFLLDWRYSACCFAEQAPHR